VLTFLWKEGRYRVDPKEIREIIEMISRSNFAEFELEGDGFKLKLVKERGAAQAATVTAGSADPPPPPPPQAPAPTPAAAPQEPAAEAAQDDGTIIQVNSPIVGTFYRSPSPDAPPFVEIGSMVKQGQVICIVEAMKVMNEIEAEIEAEVVDILVANGQPVEYGEAMFRLRPLAPGS
jgi:acetyl-CoA carboxylase biotin carboxyl carrier protein